MLFKERKRGVRTKAGSYVIAGKLNFLLIRVCYQCEAQYIQYIYIYIYITILYRLPRGYI